MARKPKQADAAAPEGNYVAIGEPALYVLPTGPFRGERRPGVISLVHYPSLDPGEPGGPSPGLVNLSVARGERDDFAGHPGLIGHSPTHALVAKTAYNGTVAAPGTWHFASDQPQPAPLQAAAPMPGPDEHQVQTEAT